SGFDRTATRDAFGTASLRSWSCLATSSGPTSESPVTFPPGRAMLATRVPSGSPPVANTMGMVVVASWRRGRREWPAPRSRRPVPPRARRREREAAPSCPLPIDAQSRWFVPRCNPGHAIVAGRPRGVGPCPPGSRNRETRCGTLWAAAARGPRLGRRDNRGAERQRRQVARPAWAPFLARVGDAPAYRVFIGGAWDGPGPWGSVLYGPRVPGVP